MYSSITVQIDVQPQRKQGFTIFKWIENWNSELSNGIVKKQCKMQLGTASQSNFQLMFILFCPPPTNTHWATTLPLLTQKLKCLIGHYFCCILLSCCHVGLLDTRWIIKKICKDWFPHFDANNVFIALKLRDLHYLQYADSFFLISNTCSVTP